MISVDLDEGSFFNTISGLDEKNVDVLSGVALRDIRAGEELLVDYEDFVSDLSWSEFGL
jgi:SET domain-containing protein